MPAAGVLVVEDERIIALDLCGKLKRLGYEVRGVAHTGEDALRLASECRPDLILLDIILNDGMDGIEVLNAIRRNSDVPAIFVSACADPPTRERAGRAACSGFVPKPVDLAVLAERMESALRTGAGR